MKRHFEGFEAFAILLCSALTFAVLCRGDVIVRNDGELLIGRILRKDSTGVSLKVDFGTLNVPREEIKRVYEGGSTNTSVLLELPDTNRIPDWGFIICQLSKQPWATSLKQIPATVIDAGVFKNVPYASFRCRGATEVNIYGDLDCPAGIEIGIYQWSLDMSMDAASDKMSCVDFIASVLPRKEDKELVKKLHLAEDKNQTNGIVVEVTPSTAEDAYGAWWLSVYSIAGLESARASKKEIEELTDPTPAKPAVFPVPPPASASNEKALPPAISYVPQYSHVSPVYRPSHPSGGGRVFVHSYTRKDGTYVSSHTRRR